MAKTSQSKGELKFTHNDPNVLGSGTVNFEVEKMQDVQVVGLLHMHVLNLIHQIILEDL